MYMGNPPVKLRGAQNVPPPLPTQWQKNRRKAADVIVVFGPQVLQSVPQLVWLYLSYVIGIWEWGHVPVTLYEETWSKCLQSVVLMAVCELSGGLLFGCVARLVRGKITPSEYGYWDIFVDYWHISNKLMNVCVKKQLLEPFISTRWMNQVLRLISNAQIDPSALVIGGNAFRDHDMVRIGQNSVVNSSTVLRTHTFEDWKLQFEYVTIHEDVVVGVNAELMTGCTLDVGCVVDHNTIVNKGEVVPPDALFVGLPGRVVGQVERSPCGGEE